jgi:type IV pilus assembly protein PilA
MNLKSAFIKMSYKSTTDDTGFTLIELLVVILITGILGAIAIPVMVRQISKAQRVEATLNLNTYQKSQQVFSLENSRFAASFSELSLPTETANYTYKAEIYPPSKPEDEGRTLACAMAIPKTQIAEMLFACISD